MSTFVWSSSDLLPTTWLVIITGSVVAAVIDIRTGRIPNWLTIPILLSGWMNACIQSGILGFGESLLAAVLLALPFVLLFTFAGGGAGDAKMMGAIGAWAGLMVGGTILLSVCLWGVILAILLAIIHRQFKHVAANLKTTVGAFFYVAMRSMRMTEFQRIAPQSVSTITMPYGLAICLGVLSTLTGVLLWTP